MIEKNSVVKVVLLSIVTLGIYVFIWAYQTMRNLDQLDGHYDKNYAVCVIFFIFVPFYSWYWFYSRSDRIAEISQQHQVLNGNNKI